MSVLNFNFSKFGGPVYSGRQRGEVIREKIELDRIDNTDDIVEITFPEDTYNITTSFFLGLLAPSIQKIGDRALFYEKFIFIMPEINRDNLEYSISRALNKDKSIL